MELEGILTRPVLILVMITPLLSKGSIRWGLDMRILDNTDYVGGS